MGSWEEQLQRTVSPRKQDRQALKDMQQTLFGDVENDGALRLSQFGESNFGQSYLASKSATQIGRQGDTMLDNGLEKSQAFRTAMDLMDSMYAQEKSQTSKPAKGFEV